MSIAYMCLMKDGQHQSYDMKRLLPDEPSIIFADRALIGIFVCWLLIVDEITDVRFDDSEFFLPSRLSPSLPIWVYTIHYTTNSYDQTIPLKQVFLKDKRNWLIDIINAYFQLFNVENKWKKCLYCMDWNHSISFSYFFSYLGRDVSTFRIKILILCQNI